MKNFIIQKSSRTRTWAWATRSDIQLLMIKLNALATVYIFTFLIPILGTSVLIDFFFSVLILFAPFCDQISGEIVLAI